MDANAPSRGESAARSNEREAGRGRGTPGNAARDQNMMILLSKPLAAEGYICTEQRFEPLDLSNPDTVGFTISYENPEERQVTQSMSMMGVQDAPRPIRQLARHPVTPDPWCPLKFACESQQFVPQRYTDGKRYSVHYRSPHAVIPTNFGPILASQVPPMDDPRFAAMFGNPGDSGEDTDSLDGYDSDQARAIRASEPWR